jgi:drug/metabolite transporter (DMT)-like permease
MFKKKVTLKILLFLIFSDILETFTHFCFKKSALPQSEFFIGKFYDIFLFLCGVFSSPFLWLGFVSVLMTFIIWASVLSKIDLSVAVPIASFSYILVPLVSIIFLHEKVSVLRWSGIFFILIGVIMVSLSSKERQASTV